MTLTEDMPYIYWQTNYFFKEFFTEEYFEKHTEEEFFQNLYKSYDALNLYLIEKYNIEISDDMEQRIDDKIKEVIKRKAIDKNQKFEKNFTSK